MCSYFSYNVEPNLDLNFTRLALWVAVIRIDEIKISLSGNQKITTKLVINTDRTTLPLSTKDMKDTKIRYGHAVLITYPETDMTKQKKSSGRPAGWHFMNEYVDKDGNVFHKGKEQPELKGTLKPTKVKPRKKKKKLTADEKLQRDIKRWNKRKKLRRGKK